MGARRHVIGIITALIVGFCAVAEAGPLIDGTLAIAARFSPVDGQFGTSTTLAGATGINFLNLNGSDTAGSGQFMVVAATGDFFPTLALQVGTIKDFSFDGASSPAYPSLPIAGFESLLVGNALKFDLNTINVVDRNDNVLHLAGTGIFSWSSAGFDPTPGSFDFFGTSSGASLSFNAAEPLANPEPGSLILLGSCLAAGAGMRALRRRRTA